MKKDVCGKIACGRQFQIQEIPLGRGQINFTWAMFLGVDLEKAGKCREVDRANKPQLSLFQFVLRYLRRLFARGEEFPRQFRLSSPKYEG